MAAAGQGMGQGMAMGMAMTPGMAMAGPSGVGGGSSLGKQGKVENMPIKEGAPEKASIKEGDDARTALTKEDTDAKRRATAENKPWVANLPKGARDSMRARDKKTLPRGYEDRLKAYFEELE